MDIAWIIQVVTFLLLMLVYMEGLDFIIYRPDSTDQGGTHIEY